MTLVLWAGCIAVGGMGFALPYSRPAAMPAEPEPVQAELLHVQLTQEEHPDTPAPSVPAETLLPSAPEPMLQPALGQPIRVVEPNPVAPFTIPLAPRLPAAPSSASQAAVVSGDPAAQDVSPVRTITYGQGEGRQPAPDYPLLARRDRQEGAVKVRFTVGPDGRVLAAEAAEPCVWPLLNESAVRTVERRWRFSSGTVRTCEVVIRFRLSR